MFNLGKPLYLYEGVQPWRRDRRIWVCQWRSFVHAKPEQRGVFLVQASHVLETKQTAKKVLRDELVLCLAFNFQVRLATADKLAWIGRAPAGAIIRVSTWGAIVVRSKDIFAGDALACSTSKT